VCRENVTSSAQHSSPENVSQKKNRLFSINPLWFRNLGESRSIHPWLHYVTIKSEKVWWLHQPPSIRDPSTSIGLQTRCLFWRRRQFVPPSSYPAAPIRCSRKVSIRPNMDRCVSSSACATLCVCALYMPCDCSYRTVAKHPSPFKVSIPFHSTFRWHHSLYGNPTPWSISLVL
jgi:hypothetical protein